MFLSEIFPALVKQNRGWNWSQHMSSTIIPNGWWQELFKNLMTAVYIWSLCYRNSLKSFLKVNSQSTIIHVWMTQVQPSIAHHSLHLRIQLPLRIQWDHGGPQHGLGLVAPTMAIQGAFAALFLWTMSLNFASMMPASVVFLRLLSYRILYWFIEVGKKAAILLFRICFFSGAFQ